MHPVEQTDKAALLGRLLSAGERDATLVFTRTKHGADRLSRQLERESIAPPPCTATKSQSARTRALDDFKQGRIQVLVATDIAARGLDIVQLPQVVNYELPHVPEVTSIASAAPAAPAARLAISLVSADEMPRLHAIQRLLGRKLPSSVVEGFSPARRNGRRHRSRPLRPRAPPPRHHRPLEHRPRTAGRSPARPPGNDGARCVPAAK